MIVDVNAYVGRWPFWRLGYETAEDLLRLLDRAGIDRAVVTSLDGVFQNDVEPGNHEVGEACRRHADRLVPFATINPHLLGWREHLRACVERHGVRGIKLHPDYHTYALVGDRRAGGEIAAIMAEAAAAKLVVLVQTSLYDVRHHPGYCFVKEVAVPEVVRALEAYPRNQFVIAGARWFGSRVAELTAQATRAGVRNFSIATDGLGGRWDGITPYARSLGGERLLFSSRSPILYSEASKDMIEQSEITAEERAAILGGNAVKMLGLT